MSKILGGDFEYLEKYVPEEYWDDMMYMMNRDDIYMYKHIVTRMYINVDSNGIFYAYEPNNDSYYPIDKETAIDNLFPNY